MDASALEEQTNMKRILFFMAGFVFMTFGMTLVLQNWSCVVTVFKGVIGGALAVVGLVILFAVTIKK